MERKKVVYISGPITGVKEYWKAFEQAEDDLLALGCVPLSPAHLPQGLTNEQYMSIDLAMMACADAVLFLPGYAQSKGAQLEYKHCEYTGKPRLYYRTEFPGAHDPRGLTLARLRTELQGVRGT